MQMPHRFLRRGVRGRAASSCRRRASTASAWCSCRTTRAAAAACEHLFEKVVRDEGQTFLGWREVPTDNSMLGQTAKRSQPVIKQLFVGRGAGRRRRRRVRAQALRDPPPRATRGAPARTCPRRRASTSPACRRAPSSTRGCSTATSCRSSIPTCATTASSRRWRWSTRASRTNTFPSWSRAHPYRYIAHNGEINTLRGNVNWMHARESMFQSRLFGDDIEEVHARSSTPTAATRRCSTTCWSC